ncbi:MAG: hypothetical protein U0414_41610 [Polyangiaceae bacterium]
MSAPSIPIAAGPGGGDVTRTTLVRFTRAATGTPKLGTPPLDDRGFQAVSGTSSFRPARGPTVGMTLGARRICVRLVREALPQAVKLFVTLRHVGGDAHPLTIVSPSGEGALHRPALEALADHVYLEAAASEEVSDPNDEALARAEVENEQRVVAFALSLHDDLEAYAKGRCDQAHVVPASGESAVDALRKALPTAVFTESAREEIRRTLDQRGADWEDAIEGIDTLVERPSLALLRAIAAGDREATAARKTAITSQLRLRRGATQKQPGTFVVEVHLSRRDGPVIAELGVVVFPPLEVELQPYFVSLGGPSSGKSIDDVHVRFHASLTMAPPEAEPKPKPKPKAKAKAKAAPIAPFGYTDLALAVGRMNVLYAPVGIRFRVDSSLPKCFRFADEADRGKLDAADDPHEWNVYHPVFNRFFPKGGLEAGRLLYDYHKVCDWPPVDDWSKRNNPWFNLVMNAHLADLQHVGRLNVWFVRQLLILGQPTEIHAMGLSRFAQTQKAATLRVSNGEDPPYDVHLGDDQVGAIVSMNALKGLDAWGRALELGHMLAHEVGHLAGLTHYLGGEAIGKPRPVVLTRWSLRSVMFNAVRFEGPLDAGYDRPGSVPGRHDAGPFFSLKAFEDLEVAPFIDTVGPAPEPVSAARAKKGIHPADQEDGAPLRQTHVSQQEVHELRETFGGTGFYGAGL